MNQLRYKFRKKSDPLCIVISDKNLSNIRYSDNPVAHFKTCLSNTLCIDANNIFIICNFMQNTL